MKIQNRKKHNLRKAINKYKRKLNSNLLNHLSSNLPSSVLLNIKKNRDLIKQSIESYLKTLYKPEIKISMVDNEELVKENKMSVEIEIPLSYFMANK